MMMRSEKGVSAVEFALIAPLLFVLTFGIIEFALLLFDKAVITNASREGARAAIVYNEDEDGVYDPAEVVDIKHVVTYYANRYLVNFGAKKDIADTDIRVEYSNDSTIDDSSWGSVQPTVSGEGWYVRVTVPYTYDFLVFPDLTRLPFIGGNFDGTIPPLVGRTVMRME